MSFSRLLEIIHSTTPIPDWAKANKAAFENLFGERYKKGAEKAIKLRAPEMAPPGVPFAAYIPFNNPDSGAYGGLSFVIFPIADGPCLVGLVVGTQGLADDAAILGRPGHARKTRAICAWLNQAYGKGSLVAWAKHDPTRIDVDIPPEITRHWAAYESIFERYGKVIYRKNCASVIGTICSRFLLTQIWRKRRMSLRVWFILAPSKHGGI